MRRIVFVFWVVAAASWVSMNGVSSAEEPTRMKEVVVTATKSKMPAKEITRAVSVVQAEDLPESRPQLADSLREVPGTLVRRSGQAGRTTSLVLRGASATQVQVVLDGAHVGSPTLGFFDFQSIPADNLERVEVMRGPASVLYGADAMAGVVNLTTHRGEGPLSGSYAQEVGNRNTFREFATVQGAKGDWHLSGSASRYDTSGLSQNDDYRRSAFSTRVGYDFSSENKLDVSLNHNLTIVGLDDGAFRPDPNRVDRLRQTIGSARWENQWTPWWSQSLRFSSQLDNLIDNDPSNGGTEANSLSKLTTERYGAEWMNRFTPVSWDTVTAGLEYEDREADRRSGGADQNFSKAQNTRAAYLQNQWNPMEPLTVITGVRTFRESSFGSDHVWEASTSYFFEPIGFKLRGGYGQGFRAPTMNELFFPNFGNPALGPERSETFEVGWDQSLLNDLLLWSATFHRTNYQDLIQVVRVTPTTFAPMNVGKARVDGIETELEWHPLAAWTVKGSYTATSAHDRATEDELLRIPNNTAGLSLKYAAGRWESRLDGLLISSREESTGTNSRNKIEGYFKLDFYAGCRIREWLETYVRVENLTNRNYQEILGFPSEGITGIIGIKVKR